MRSDWIRVRPKFKASVLMRREGTDRDGEEGRLKTGLGLPSQ